MFVQKLYQLNGGVHLGIFHTEWKDNRKARSPNTEGRVLSNSWYVEQR